MSLPIALRRAVADDVVFVLNSWLKSYRNADAVRTVPNDVYYSEGCGQKTVVMEALENADTLIACNPDDPEAIYGWVNFLDCGESLPPVINYVYVKQAYRRHGIGRALLKGAGVLGVAPFVATHETRVAREIRGDRALYVLNPWWAMYTERLVEYQSEN